MAYDPLISASDIIAFKEIDTGGQKAGNGGDGYSSGAIINKPHLEFSPHNKADGANVDVTTGDDVYQKADWDAGGAKGGDASVKKADDVWAKATGGTAKSNGDQYSESGHNKSYVDAHTIAAQENALKVDMSQMVSAGNGGDGGHGNLAKGGEVSFALVHSNPTSETANLNDVLNDSGHFAIDDFLHV
jgi:hypothetical protein